MQSYLSKVFNEHQKIIFLGITVILISILLFFRNTLFESSLLLKEFGKSSIDPEVAFLNDKPTYLEFYAEWCEVCQEMASMTSEIKNEFQTNINFVFLNVDNPKWDKYIKKYNVNGIPQINLFDANSNLKDTFIGLQNEDSLKDSILKLN
tara:strand:+ start:7883 stop:8332 length:450 start_codon:yes stop_codon:yes gene_type:complete